MAKGIFRQAPCEAHACFQSCKFEGLAILAFSALLAPCNNDAIMLGLSSGVSWPAGPSFQEFVSLFYGRCEQIVGLQLQARSANAAGQPSPEYQWQFVVCSLDLISGLADGIGPPLAAVVSQGQLNCLLPQCCKVLLMTWA